MFKNFVAVNMIIPYTEVECCRIAFVKFLYFEIVIEHRSDFKKGYVGASINVKNDNAFSVIVV